MQEFFIILLDLLRYFLTLENIIKPARRSILQIFRKATKAGLTLFQHYPQTAAARIFKERSCGTLLQQNRNLEIGGSSHLRRRVAPRNSFIPRPCIHMTMELGSDEIDSESRYQKLRRSCSFDFDSRFSVICIFCLLPVSRPVFRQALSS